MSKQYDNTNRGALFKNDRKESETHPDLSGQINVEGKQFWISGWNKRNEDGTFKVCSLSVKPKESTNRGGGTQKPRQPEPEDEIFF